MAARHIQFSSFKAKLVATILGITFIALLLSSLGMAILEVRNFRNSLSTSTLSNAAILSFNLVPFLLFDDEQSAVHLLSSLETLPHIRDAAVYKLDEGGIPILLANYPGEPRDYQYHDLVYLEKYLDPAFEGLHYQLTYPIKVDDEVIGYLYINSIFDQIGRFQQELFFTFAAIMLCCLLLALIIALRFQSILLAPLDQMVRLTREVSNKKDYSLRVEESRHDEFRYLAQNFNHMLEAIQKNDSRQKAVEDEIRLLNLHLEDKVNQRTSALESSNNHLQKAMDELNNSQKKLVEREKMASLGGLVAGIAHEVNTPIGVGVTASSHLAGLLKKLKQRYESGELSPEDLEVFLRDANEGVEITSSNLFRAADLVKSFKQVAVDQSSSSVRSLNIRNYLHEILMSLRPTLKKVPHDIQIHCDEQLTIQCNAGAISQVLTNLIINSLTHGFDGVEHGTIEISFEKSGQNISLNYADDGNGMEEESLQRIFEPFYTTRRNQGGSGLGTHLIYNLVTQALNGEITVSGSPGLGLSFNITFPEAEAGIT